MAGHQRGSASGAPAQQGRALTWSFLADTRTTKREVRLFDCCSQPSVPWERDVQKILRQVRPEWTRPTSRDYWAFAERADQGPLRALAVMEHPRLVDGVVVADLYGIGVHRDFRGRGLGRTGLELMISQVTSLLRPGPVTGPLVVLRAQVHDDNEASRRMCTGLGFTPEPSAQDDGYRWWQAVDPGIVDLTHHG